MLLHALDAREARSCDVLVVRPDARDRAVLDGDLEAAERFADAAEGGDGLGHGGTFGSGGIGRHGRVPIRAEGAGSEALGPPTHAARGPCARLIKGVYTRSWKSTSMRFRRLRNPQF